MDVRTRTIRPPLVLALLVALTGGAIGLGVSEAPTGGPGPTLWESFLSDTTGPGSLAFSSFTLSSGPASSVTVTRGAIDFSTHSARSQSVVRSPMVPDQWDEITVVEGKAYQRPGKDVGGSGRFSGVWTPATDFNVVPFAPVAGPAGNELPVREVTLRSLGRVVVDGALTTKYGLTSLSITCAGTAGSQESENISSLAWVDNRGRIRRFEEVKTISVGGVTTTQVTITRFGQFGVPVNVPTPARIAGPAQTATSNPTANRFAGCLLTPS